MADASRDSLRREAGAPRCFGRRSVAQILIVTTMQIRPIRTDKDHRNALAEIEKLWGASAGTPAGDKLNILATLVETYESGVGPSGAGAASTRRMYCIARSRN